MGIRALQTVDEVIDTLGGTGATAKLTDRKPQHVSNWRAEKRLPSNQYFVMLEQLQERNFTAPPSLWGIIKPRRRRKKPARKS